MSLRDNLTLSLGAYRDGVITLSVLDGMPTRRSDEFRICFVLVPEPPNLMLLLF
jgi:hypothetical protein